MHQKKQRNELHVQFSASSEHQLQQHAFSAVHDAYECLRELAARYAICGAGSDAVIRCRAGIILRRVVVELSSLLARELSERVCAHVRGALMAGRDASPV